MSYENQKAALRQRALRADEGLGAAKHKHRRKVSFERLLDLRVRRLPIGPVLALRLGVAHGADRDDGDGLRFRDHLRFALKIGFGKHPRAEGKEQHGISEEECFHRSFSGVFGWPVLDGVCGGLDARARRFLEDFPKKAP